jgi:hypothetical protein
MGQVLRLFRFLWARWADYNSAVAVLDMVDWKTGLWAAIAWVATIMFGATNMQWSPQMVVVAAFVVAACMAIIVAVVRLISFQHPSFAEKRINVVADDIWDELPDVRIADNPRACKLFESDASDKLFPLMESGRLTVWARPMRGDYKLLRLPGNTWRTHFLAFLPKQGEQTQHQTFVKTQAGQQSIWFDVHFNQKQIERIWPELEWIPILTAARIAYEAMESSGLEGVITSPGQTAAGKLAFFVDMMTSREDCEIQLRGRKPPSTVLRPIPQEEFPHLHLIPNTNNLGPIIASEPTRYNDVEIIRADLNDHISWLQDIANEKI